MPMRIELIQAIAEKVAHTYPNTTPEFPGCVQVIDGEYQYWFGDANETWDGDIYRGEEETGDHLRTNVLTTSTNIDAFVAATLERIAQFKEYVSGHSHTCSVCRKQPWEHNDTKCRTRIENIAKEAEQAFWEKVAEFYPEATSGDCDPMAAHNFSQQCERAVAGWVDANVATEVSKCR